MQVLTDVATKSGAQGIRAQVTRHSTAIVLPAQGTLEIPRLPEPHRRSKGTVDTPRGPPLQASNDGRKGRLPETQQRVEMIGHHHPRQPFGNPPFVESAQDTRQAAAGVKIQKHGAAVMHDRGYDIFPAGPEKRPLRRSL